MGFVRTLSVLCIVIAGGAAFAQPVLDVSTDTLDFGTVTPRQFVMGTVEVYNRGNDTLIIKNIETSCGCTAATPDASRIAFMETATIRMSMNIDHKSGRFVQWVRLKTNDPKRADKDIYMTVTILPPPDSLQPK